MPGASAAPVAGLPVKGSSMGDVEKTFGEPSTRHPTVGGGSPKQPPITRWDYPGFTVVFEKDKVVHTVVPGAPPRLQTQQGLEPVAVPEAAPTATYEPPAEPEPGTLQPPADSAAPPAEAMPPTEAMPPAEATPPDQPPPPAEPPPAETAPAETAPAPPAETTEEPKPLP